MSALLNSYSASNRVVDTALSVRYSKVRITGNWSYSPSTTETITFYEAWCFTRTATKSYRYVGMTQSAANSCAEDMRKKYQRNIQYSQWQGGNKSEFEDQDGGDMPMADIAVNRVGGGMYEVVISVNETDSRLRVDHASYSYLFSSENSRNYDE